MPHVDPPKIDEAANNVLSEPLAYMQHAQKYLEDACAGNPMLFGAIGLPIVQVQYAHTRELHLNNIKAGGDKLKEMANGLSYTAAHWANAERANTPVGKPPHLEYKKPDGGGYAKNAFEFAGLYWVASLAAARLAAEGSIMACGTLAPAALTAMGIWALWTPDDDGLTEVQGGWEAASGAVQAVIDQLGAALKPLDAEGAWDADDRHAFDTWLASFKTELGQTKDDLKAVADRIKTLHDDLNDTQLKFLIFSLVCLAMIVFYTALEATPAAPVAEALKNIQALVLGVGAAGTLVEIGVLLVGALFFGKSSLFPDLPGLTGNADGKGDGLKDITISWDDSYAAQFGH
jgi:type IV secretory pathway VirB2 component (pilin)